jgi:hypothetical protein
MRSLYVPIDETRLEKLGRLARAERRHPKDTASLLLERAIDEAEPTSATNAVLRLPDHSTGDDHDRAPA